MEVQFKNSGKVALNYGIDGIIEVKAGDIMDIKDEFARILIENDIAFEQEKVKEFTARPAKEEAKEEVVEVDVKEKPKAVQEIEDLEDYPAQKEDREPKRKRGRPAKAK